MTEEMAIVVRIAASTAIGIMAFLWTSLRIRYYMRIDPEKSMAWQAVSNVFQGLLWLLGALFTGVHPLFNVSLSNWIPALLFVAYLISWIIAFAYEESQLQRILDRRQKVHQHWKSVLKEGENQDAEIT